MKKPYLLQMAAGGATRNALTKKMIEELEIDIPILEKQKKIVSIIDDLQKKIKKNNEINENLEWQQMLGAEWREIQKIYLHTIGNLTLTAYNSEMSDRSFMVKMDMEGGFKESALRLNSYIVKLTEWNEQRIKERAVLLADKAKQIWAYPDLTDAELAPYQMAEKPAERYSLETYDTNIFTKTLFEVLDRRIQNLSPNVKREFKKLYVAYKLDTNFVDVVFQKQRLRISVNMKFSEVNDPQGICHDITGLGRWGNGDVELFMEHTSEVDQIMEIVKQSYKFQVDD